MPPVPWSCGTKRPAQWEGAMICRNAFVVCISAPPDDLHSVCPCALLAFAPGTWNIFRIAKQEASSYKKKCVLLRPNSWLTCSAMAVWTDWRAAFLRICWPHKKTDKTLKVHRLEWAFMRDPLSCFLWFGSWVSEFGSHLIGTCRTGKKYQKAMTSCLQAAQRTLRPQCSELPAWYSPNQAQLDMSRKVLLLLTLFRSNFRLS